MKTAKTKTETSKWVIQMTMMAGKTGRLEFSNSQQARELYDLLRNVMQFYGEPIRQITFEEL